MSSADDPRRMVADLTFTTSAATDERILADAAAALTGSRPSATDAAGSGVGTRRPSRRPMLARLTTAAGFVLLVAVVAVPVLRSTPVAYALEQTLEANRELRFAHARSEVHTEHGREISETWIQLDDGGDLLRLRMELSHADGGPKVVVWEQGLARVWFTDRNLAVIVAEPDMPGYLDDLLAQVDPRATMRMLHDARAAGQIAIETIAPAREGGPIELVSTFTHDPGWKTVYLIDPESKLVQRSETYAFRDGAQRLQRRVEYLEYNQAPAAGVFALDLPEEVTVIDQTRQEIGLPQGDLADEQVAVRVAREFFEAMVADDHARAGRMADGLPADRVQAFMGDLLGVEDYLRVVSIGEATRDAEYAATAFLCVPCTIEVLVDGRAEVRTFVVGIRPVHGRPDRWSFSGVCGAGPGH